MLQQGLEIYKILDVNSPNQYTIEPEVFSKLLFLNFFSYLNSTLTTFLPFLTSTSF